MNQPKTIKPKKQAKITINTSKKNSIFPPFKSLKNILKEKVLYDNLCSIHHFTYFKYCISCKKDICCQCEIESHKGHSTINYENILPDLNEINVVRKTIKEYKNSYLELIKIINLWKKNFDNMLYEYENQMDIIIEYINKFNNEKNNFNNIFKFRSICSLLLDNTFNKDKNIKIVEVMEKILKEKNKNENNYIQKIKKDYICFISHNKLIKLIKTLNRDTFLKQIENIINIIDYKNENKDNNYGKSPNLNFYKNNIISSYDNNNTSASTFNKNFYKKSTYQNSKTININRNIKENSEFKINAYTDRNYKEEKNKDKENHSKSTNNINYHSNNRYKLCIYEKKSLREKSNEDLKPKFMDKIENTNNLRNNTFRDNANNNNIKMDKNILQETINKVIINHNIYDNYLNNNLVHKIIKRKKRNNLIPNKTQNLVNKSLIYDYKGFEININDKYSGAQLLNNSSYTIEGIKYCSNSLRSNSLEYRPYNYKYFGTLGREYINNNSNSLDNKNKTLTIDRSNSDYKLINQMMTLNEKHYRTINNYSYNKNNLDRNNKRNKSNKSNNDNFNSSLVNFYKHKINNSLLTVNKYDINNSLAGNNNKIISNNENDDDNSRNKKISNKIYNNAKKNKKIYVHKKYNYTQIDDTKNLSSIDSISNSISSSIGNNNNVNKNNNIKENYSSNGVINKCENTNNNFIHINGNKPLFIGLELGNSICKIGVINKKNNFQLFNYNNNNNYSIPTIISFVENSSNNDDDIKIGEEAEQLKVSNPSFSIFNIIKLFGKNYNEIVGRKDLWPFNIYNNEKENKPYIKIKCKNNKEEKTISYYFEEILTLFLKKVFDNFFKNIVIDKKEEVEQIKLIEINMVISVPNYFNYIQREMIKQIFISKLFPKNEIYRKSKIFIKSNIYGKYNIQLNNIKIESVSNLVSFSLINNEMMNKNIKNNSINYLIIYIDGGSVNISIVNISNNKNSYSIELKGISGAEFGEEDFVDNFVYICLSDFKDKVKKNCLSSPIALAKLRKSINIVKNCFNKQDIFQTEVNINKLYDEIDLKMTINKNDYYKSCIGLFRKIIYLVKDTILNSNIKIKNINDIILLGNIAQNSKLKIMISELFKDDNQIIYNKLIDKKYKDNDLNNHIIYGAIIQCFNSNMALPKYKFINLTYSSYGIETLNGLMDIVIEKGSNIPIKFNKYIKIKKPDEKEKNMININIYEGENKYIKNNRLISSNFIDINNFKNEKIDENNIELLFQFFIDSNYVLNVYILDKISFKKKYECLINLDKIKNRY